MIVLRDTKALLTNLVCIHLLAHCSLFSIDTMTVCQRTAEVGEKKTEKTGRKKHE